MAINITEIGGGFNVNNLNSQPPLIYINNTLCHAKWARINNTLEVIPDEVPQALENLNSIGLEISLSGNTPVSAAAMPDYSQRYLTYDILTSGTIVWKKINNSASSITISYRKNNGSWTEITSSIEGITINVNTGDKVEFKGTNDCIGGRSDYNCFSGTATFNLSGNIMSLIGGDDFNNVSFPTLYEGTFANLWHDNIGVINAFNLRFPSTTYFSCYYKLFSNCSNLITAPAILPSNYAEDGCYESMFENCTSLTSTPILSATSLITYCYWGMFRGCTSLTSAPELPATTLASDCYAQMFAGCTSLTSAPALPAAEVTYFGYSQMFSGCTSLTSAPALPATTLGFGCYDRMFSGCTSLSSAPALPATTLNRRCYEGMFSGCTSLTSAPALPATNLAYECYSSMFAGCTNLTSSPLLSATNLVTECYYHMFYGCSNLNTITCYATSNLGTGYTNDWTYGVSSTGTFVGDDQVSWPRGTSGIPQNWSTNTFEPPTSAGTLGMYVDDFPDYAWEDNGNENVYEFIEEYMNNPTQGGNYYEYCQPFEYNGDTYYIWVLTDNGHNGVIGNEENNGSIKYLLTNTINLEYLQAESLEYEPNIVNSNTNPICFLNEDLNTTYTNGETYPSCIVKVFSLQ